MSPRACYASGVSRHALGLLVLAWLAVGCDAGTPRLRAVHGERGGAVERPEPAPAIDPPPATAPSEEPAHVPAAEPSREGWNEAQIRWEPYEAGLARARRESLPVLLVVSATWCGHCRTYSHVFEDAGVVQRAQRFVMVHLDSDVEREEAARYVVDGHYVPRTYFLAPDGTPMPVTALNPRFRYFYDENGPASLIAGMDAALARAGG